MSHVIPKDINITQDLAMSLIAQQFGLAIRSCRLIGEGFDNMVFCINEKLVFRFPRRRIAIELIELEMKLLGSLSAQLPLSIPRPIFLGTPSTSYEAPFYGHEFLAGTTGCSVNLSLADYENLARDLALFLKSLHAIDIKSLSMSPQDLKPVFDRVDMPQMTLWLDQRFESIKQKYNLAKYINIINFIKNQAQKYIPKQKPLVLVHGDLYHRHLLFDSSNKLSGLIDWGDSCVSDRVVDLGIVYQFLPKAVHDKFWHHYGTVSEAERDYAIFLGLYYAIALLWFGSDRGDQALISSSLACLENITMEK